MARGPQGRLMDMHGGVHWVPDGDSARLNTVGQELTKIRCGNPQQGRRNFVLIATSSGAK